MKRFPLRLEPLEDRRLLAAGDLDTTFNGAGYAVTTGSSNNYEFAYDVLVQPNDRKIVSVGVSSNSQTLKASSYVMRHLENGQRDPSFGNNGVVNIGLGGSNYFRNTALQADGKILLAGQIRNGGWTGSRDIAIVRLNANGSMDKSFGNRGSVVADLGGGREAIEGIAIQPDGKIVVVGWTEANGDQFFLARYNTNGSLDGSFGSGGKVLADMPNGEAYFRGIALQSDGKIVVAGNSGVGYQFTIARFTSSGALDTHPTTGLGPVDPGSGLRAGYSITTTATDRGSPVSIEWAQGNEAYAEDVAIQPDGRIVAVGRAGRWIGDAWNVDYIAARCLADGSADASFDGTGATLIDFTDGTYYDYDYGRSVAIQSDGKIIVAGDPAPLGMGLARLNADGSLDATFGNGGRVVAPAGEMRDAYEIALQPWDGKIVASGGAGLTKSNFVVARLLTESTFAAAASESSDPALIAASASASTSNADQPPAIDPVLAPIVAARADETSGGETSSPRRLTTESAPPASEAAIEAVFADWPSELLPELFHSAP